MPPESLSELESWQRKVRHLEQAGREAVEKDLGIVKSQRAQIEKLKQDNARMQDELASDQVPARQPSNTQQERVDKLYELADSFQRKIEVERRQVEQIEKELEVYHAKVDEARKAPHDPKAAGAAQQQAARGMKVLENRLEQAEKRFNESISKNKELRDLIDDMAKQQATSQAILTKLENQLVAERAKVAALQDAANTCLDVKTVALEEALALAAQGDREEVAFQNERKVLDGCLKTDKDLLELQTKRFTRVLAASGPASPSVDGGSSVDGEAAAAASSATPEEAVEQLRRATNIQELQELLAHCRSLEAGNFRIFSTCEAASQEVARLQKEVSAAQTELRSMELEGVLGKQKDVIRQTLGKRDQTMRRLEALREKHGAVQQRLVMVQRGISGVLKNVGTPAPPLLPSSSSAASAPSSSGDHATSGAQPSGPSSGLAASLLQQLALLEARARALVAVHATMMGKPSQMSAAVSGRFSGVLPSTTGSSAALSGKKKSQQKGGRGAAAGSSDEEDSDEEDEEEEMPLTRQQIQARLQR